MLVLISLACLMFSPESPRYLVEVRKMDEARAVLQRLYGTEYADEAMREIQEAVELEESVAVRKWSDCFQNNKQCFRYRTLCAIGCNFFQQATGINVCPCLLLDHTSWTLLTRYFRFRLLRTMLEPSSSTVWASTQIQHLWYSE